MERPFCWVKDIGSFSKYQVESRLIYREPPKSYIRSGRDNASSVILIPGIFEQWNVLKRFGDSISEAGHNVYTVRKLGNNLYNLNSSANIVGRVIRGHKLEDVVLVGFSKGGVIAMKVLDNGDADLAYTLATPFYGSYLAEYFPFDSIAELGTQNEEIKTLREKENVKSRVYSIYPEYDNFMPDPWGCHLEGARANIRCPIRGHHAILSYKKAIDFVTNGIVKRENEKKSVGMRRP